METLLLTFAPLILGIVVIVGALARRKTGGAISDPREAFARTESAFRQLKGQFDAGKLTEAEFKARLADLMLQDSQGHWWMIGYETGKWYINDDDRWTQAKPPRTARTASPGGVLGVVAGSLLVLSGIMTLAENLGIVSLGELSIFVLICGLVLLCIWPAYRAVRKSRGP